MVHANGAEAVRIALAAGCDSIEHGYFMGEANLRQMADSGIVWVPTLIPMAALTKLDILSPKQKDIAGKTLEHQMDQISQAVTLGVTIGLGTDAGSIGVNHGSAVREELELLIESGLTLEQAIQCATVHNAVLMGRSQSGAVAKGNLADLLIIPGPPEDVISKMCGPLWKCRKGKWHLPD